MKMYAHGRSEFFFRFLLAVIFLSDILISVISVGSQRADLVATDRKMSACICIEMGINVAVAYAKSCRMCFFLNSLFVRFWRLKFFLFWHPNLIANVRRALSTRQNVAKKRIFLAFFMWLFFCLACARSHARVSDGLVRCLFVWYFPFLLFVVRVCITIFLSTRNFEVEKKSHTQSRWNCVDLLGLSAVSVGMNERRKNENNSRLLVDETVYIYCTENAQRTRNERAKWRREMYRNE